MIAESPELENLNELRNIWMAPAEINAAVMLTFSPVNWLAKQMLVNGPESNKTMVRQKLSKCPLFIACLVLSFKICALTLRIVSGGGSRSTNFVKSSSDKVSSDFRKYFREVSNDSNSDRRGVVKKVMAIIGRIYLASK